jgi:hypothetical protein
LPGYDANVEAICCRLEHADGGGVEVFVPFHNRSNRYEFDKPVVLSRSRQC